MTERLDDVWATRDYPVLLYVTQMIDEGRRGRGTADIANALGMPKETANQALKALSRRGLIECSCATRDIVLAVTDVTGAAYT